MYSNLYTYNGGFGFKDAVKQANEYAYDANGNLTKDLNKNTAGIQYNCLNLPDKVTFSDGSTITYTYAADGTKQKTVHKIGGTTTTTDYCGNVVYENGVQKLLLTEAGYVTLSDGKYYYGARHYDAALGRFATVDRFAEKYPSMSTYQYGANNPVKNIDVNGDSIRVYTETTSNHGLGHAWISAGEGDKMVIYTYGRYDGTNKGADGSSNSVSDGPGVLVRLTGEAALSYNNERASKTKVSIFTVTDIPDDKLLKVMDERFNSSMQLPTHFTGEYRNNPAAHIIDEYNILRNNCATTVSNALNSAGSNVLKGDIQLPTDNIGMWKSVPILKVYNTPLGLQNHMKGISGFK